MRIAFENVNFNSNSGPNGFSRKLASSLLKKGHEITTSSPDVQLSFIQSFRKIAPLVQRLDGIYFNTDQDWKVLNEPIKKTYNEADAVIFQTKFDKDLVENFFGYRSNCHVVHNGTDLELISGIPKADISNLGEFENIWCSASHWRPHKRLSDNVRYFLEFSSKDDCLIVAGKDSQVPVHPRIFNVGNLSWDRLISIFKRSDYFLHLSWLDHCPNVVIDARASGCKIVCSNSGGTKEIAGIDSTLVCENKVWDFSPVELYKPPDLDFQNIQKNKIDSTVDIDDSCQEYINIFNYVKTLGVVF
jgi:glycosyltransferase involved in cell wall biosynthesis